MYLVLARPRGFQRRDTLLSLFWPELRGDRGRKALSQGLFFLRGILPKETPRTRGTEEVGVDFHRIRCDVIQFEAALTERRWARAQELYQGELLAGFHLTRAPGFEEWLASERERLREMAAGAAWSTAMDRLEAGEPVEAVAVARQAIALGLPGKAPPERSSSPWPGPGTGQRPGQRRVVMAGCVPRQGDLVWLYFDPQTGHGQAERRPALVLSPESYNVRVGLAIIRPVTSQEKGYPFEVVLPSRGAVAGVILSDQVKSLDWRARRAERIEALLPQVTEEVLRVSASLKAPCRTKQGGEDLKRWKGQFRG